MVVSGKMGGVEVCVQSRVMGRRVVVAVVVAVAVIAGDLTPYPFEAAFVTVKLIGRSLQSFVEPSANSNLTRWRPSCRGVETVPLSPLYCEPLVREWTLTVSPTVTETVVAMGACTQYSRRNNPGQWNRAFWTAWPAPPGAAGRGCFTRTE